MKTLFNSVMGALSVAGLVALQGCGGTCIDDGFVWQQSVKCEVETASATETASASESESESESASTPTEGSNSNSGSMSASVTESSNSGSNSESVSGTETTGETESASATATESASDTDGGLWCADADGDGFGDPLMCMDQMFPGAVPNDDDCDDSNADAFPGSAELDSETQCQEDGDGDGYGNADPLPGIDPGTDCADGDAEVHVDCSCTAGTGSCDGDDLHVCNAEGDGEVVTTCEFGCDDQGVKCWDALTVEAGPSVCVDPNQPIQLNAMASGGDGMYGFDWTPADTLDDSKVQSPNATPAGATQYTVAVNDGEGNMASDTVSVFVKNQSLTLDPNICTVYDFPHEDNPENNDPKADWAWNEQSKELCQTKNAKASALFCGWELDNATITGTFSVNTAEDDDWVGFMWGIQDTSHFYVFTWKQLGQLATTCGNVLVPAGMQVKVVDVQDPMANPMSCVDIHEAADTANSKLLVGVDEFSTMGWADNTEYEFELTHKADGEMTIVVRRANNNMIVAQKTFMDTTYASGKFGMYTKSQVNACFSDFTVDCI